MKRNFGISEKDSTRQSRMVKKVLWELLIIALFAVLFTSIYILAGLAVHGRFPRWL